MKSDDLKRYIQNDDIISLKAMSSCLSNMHLYRLEFSLNLCMTHDARKSLAYLATFWRVSYCRPLLTALCDDKYEEYLSILLCSMDINAPINRYDGYTLAHSVFDRILIDRMHFILSLPDLDLFVGNGYRELPIDSLDRAMQRNTHNQAIYDKLKEIRVMVVSMMDKHTYVLEIC